MAEVFVCEKGSLTGPSKSQLRKAGVVVAEVDDITKCQFVRSSEVISHDDMLWAALEALRFEGKSYGDKGIPQRERLAVNLFKIADAARRGEHYPALTTEAP